jgi:glycosyltransferase involved in cell wall biosynthesis
MSKLLIGMPVYNGQRFMEEALNSLVCQTYSDWKMIISDNGSDDETETIGKRFSERDARITYYRHETNSGPYHNFKFCLDQADTEYFMWAAADDLWLPRFVESGIRALDGNRRAAMFFCNISCVDSFGRICREVPPLDRFATSSKTLNVFRYVKDPEIFGKANLFYSMYRTSIVRGIFYSMLPFACEAGDICFSLSILSRYPVAISNEVLFKKRWVRETDRKTEVDVVKFTESSFSLLDFPDFKSYIECSLKAVRGTIFHSLVWAILKARVLRARLHSLFSPYFRAIA